MISLNVNDNFIIQPDDNVNFIIQPKKNMDVQNNVIIQPDDNIYVIFQPDDNPNIQVNIIFSLMPLNNKDNGIIQPDDNTYLMTRIMQSSASSVTMKLGFPHFAKHKTRQNCFQFCKISRKGFRKKFCEILS
jgi:hypothetical protein